MSDQSATRPEDPAARPRRTRATEPAAGLQPGVAAELGVGGGAGAGAGASGAAGTSGAAATSGGAGAPVRRRGKALEQAIFAAALEQLTSGGFARLTMEGVAGAAQTGKAALYRRWPSKLELVLDALGATLPLPTDTPDLGSLSRELTQLIGAYCVGMEAPAGAAMRVLMAELDHESGEIFKNFVTGRLMEPAKLAVLTILRRGELRGEVRTGAATPLVADVALAMLLYRSKFSREQLSPEFCEQLVQEILLPLVRP